MFEQIAQGYRAVMPDFLKILPESEGDSSPLRTAMLSMYLPVLKTFLTVGL